MNTLYCSVSETDPELRALCALLRKNIPFRRLPGAALLCISGKGDCMPEHHHNTCLYYHQPASFCRSEMAESLKREHVADYQSFFPTENANSGIGLSV